MAITLDDMIESAADEPRPTKARKRRSPRKPKSSIGYTVLPNLKDVTSNALIAALEDSPSVLARDWLNNLEVLLTKLVEAGAELTHTPLVLSLLEKIMLARAGMILTRLPTTALRLQYLTRLAISQGDLNLASKVIRMSEELRITSNPDEAVSPALMEALDRIASVQESSDVFLPGHAESTSRLIEQAQRLVDVE